jgi:hypothetical protein
VEGGLLKRCFPKFVRVSSSVIAGTVSKFALETVAVAVKVPGSGTIADAAPEEPKISGKAEMMTESHTDGRAD